MTYGWKIWMTSFIHILLSPLALRAASFSLSRPFAHSLCDFAPHSCCSHCSLFFSSLTFYLSPRLPLTRMHQATPRRFWPHFESVVSNSPSLAGPFHSVSSEIFVISLESKHLALCRELQYHRVHSRRGLHLLKEKRKKKGYSFLFAEHPAYSWILLSHRIWKFRSSQSTG